MKKRALILLFLAALVLALIPAVYSAVCPGELIKATPNPVTWTGYAYPGGECAGPRYICATHKNPYTELTNGEQFCVSNVTEAKSSDFYCGIDGTAKTFSAVNYPAHPNSDPTTILRRVLSCANNSQCLPNENCADGICSKISECKDTDGTRAYTSFGSASCSGGGIYYSYEKKNFVNTNNPLVVYDICYNESTLLEAMCATSNTCTQDIVTCTSGNICSQGVCKPGLFGPRKGLLNSEKNLELPFGNFIISGIGMHESQGNIVYIMLEFREIYPNCSLGPRRTLDTSGKLDEPFAGKFFISVPEGNYAVTGFGFSYSSSELKGIMLQYREIKPNCLIGANETPITAGAGFETAQYAPENNFIVGVGMTVSGNSQASSSSIYREFLSDLDENKDACQSRFENTGAWGDYDNNISSSWDNCCGDDKKDDIGTIADFGQELCYNSGYERSIGTDFSQDVAGEWGWRLAQSYNLSIKTIIKNNTQFDVAADTNKWHQCGGSEIKYGNTLPYAKSFICYEDKNSFSQCCPVNSDTCTANKDVLGVDKTRGLGELITSLAADYPQIYFNEEPYSGYLGSESYYAIPITETKTKISNWTRYSSFEFDFRPEELYDFQLLVLSGDGVEISNPQELTVMFRKSISDYAVDSPKVGEWQHIVVPISQFKSAPVNVSQIVFFVNTSNLAGTTGIEIDNLLLKDSSSARNIYCSEKSEWISDLDNEKGACADYSSFSWTGKNCCGDDNSFASPEYFLGNESACWKGNNLAATIMEIEFKVNAENRSYVCKSNECEYYLSINNSATVQNLHPEIYQLLFADEAGNETLIQTSIASLKSAKMIARRVPQQILFYNNSLYGCNASQYMLNKLPVNNAAKTCSIVGGYFCSPSLGWSNAESGAGARNTTSVLPAEVPLIGSMVKSNCCAKDYCWNGTDCIASMHQYPNAAYSFNGTNQTYRCVFGAWGISLAKKDWSNDKIGFCPKTTDCLVDPYANAESNYKPDLYSDNQAKNPQCIADKQFIEDHYCMNGTWTSRTKYIALQLLNISSSSQNFVLYCDIYQNSLADYNYGNVNYYLGGRYIGGIGNLEQRACYTQKEGNDLFGGAISYQKPCVNNFCLIKTNDDLIFGTSLNRHLGFNSTPEDRNFSFLIALGKPSALCYDVYGSGEYKKCGNINNQVWYNNITNSVIYSAKGVNLNPVTSFSRLWDFFTGVFRWITGTWEPKNALGDKINLTLLGSVKDYSRLYVQKQGSKTVYGIAETPEPGKTIITVRYENVSTDLCDSVEKISKEDPYKGTLCNRTGNKFTIISDVPEIWQELTSSLRLG